MKNYIDGYAFPIQEKHVDKYKRIAEEIAEIWKEHGAIAYCEYVGENLKMEGIPTFPEMLNTSIDETVIFGWIEFESKEARDLAHKLVANDKRMTELVSPLMDPSQLIFNAKRMVFGGFQSLIESR